MTEQQFVDFCSAHGACNVDIDGEIIVSFALDLLHEYFKEHPCGAISSLREVYHQISKIEEISV